MLSGRVLNDDGRQNHGRQSGPTGISHAALLAADGFQHLHLFPVHLSAARPGAGGCWQVRPPNLTLRDHHSVRSSLRRATQETNSSLSWPTSIIACSIDSVTLSGAWRARYSRKASVKSRLRDLRVRRARRSVPSNRSLGMEIAVFIPEYNHMTNSWREHRSASLSADSEVLRQHPAAQSLVNDHNAIPISQVTGG